MQGKNANKAQIKLMANSSRTFECDDEHYVTVSAYDTGRMERVDFGEFDKRRDRTHKIVETNYKITLNPKNSPEKTLATYEINASGGTYNIPKIIDILAEKVKKEHNIIIPEDKIIDCIKHNQQKTSEKYPSSKIDAVNVTAFSNGQARFTFSAPSKTSPATLQ